MDNPAVDAELDARGLYCPEPVMLLHGRILDIPPGGILRVLATDPSTVRDIPRFCQFLGHKLLTENQPDGEFHFLIQRGG